jgi:hypothetical protein
VDPLSEAFREAFRNSNQVLREKVSV